MKLSYIIVLLAVIFVVAVVAIDQAQAENNVYYVRYTVQAGETLWSIVNDHYPNEVTGEMVLRIRSINARDGEILLDPLIRPRQVILLPMD